MKELTIGLEQQELAIILDFLRMGQYSVVKELITKIENQIIPQLDENRQ